MCSFLAASLDIVIGKKQFRDVLFTQEQMKISKKLLFSALVKLFIVLVLFLMTIVIVNYFFNLNFILSVSLVIFPFALFWSLAMRRSQLFLSAGWKSWIKYNNTMQNFVVLFLSLAFFSEWFNQTGFPYTLQSFLDHVTAYPIVIFIFFKVIYFATAMIGVHPIVTVAIVIESLSPLFHVINPLSIGIVLIVTALATSASAPYGINATMTVHHLGVNPYRITRTNTRFSLMVSTIGVVIASLLL
ncbi:hypothetical protein J2S74_005430 [Evansella vedderi]|uniref:Citrate transporter-like domain-containing protein n=1 Tax=Evansella vedderi TaxID=38282 RepID=A0ABU0A4L4_9BACI|nr:hypothetical protein [Evansella vedderi]MDQ0257967.1 hypothetical protein [Evansella vedderi]